MMKRLSAYLLALSLWATPALGANQASVQTPTTGPHSATDFTTNFLNPALLALFTCNWGPTAPINGPGVASMQYQCWFDTSAAPDVAFKYYDGTSFVLAGRLNTSTHVWSVADADLHCIEILATTGLIARTGAGTCLARSVTGTASEITVTNGDGVSGQPTVSLPASMVFTGKTIAGGSYSGITGFGIRSTGAAFDVRFAATEVLTADRTLTWVLGDANRSITLGGNVSIGGALTFSGAFSFTGTLTGATTVTFPTVGTLATLAGTEALSNKTITSSTINCASNTCTVRIGSDVSGLGTGVAAAAANALNASGGFVAPTPTRAGDVIYWNGSAYVTLPGNNSGTQFLQENASGVPSWVTVSGTGTVTQVICGTALTGGTITSSGTCAIDKATSANLEAGTADKVLTGDNVYDAEKTITFSATQTLDFGTFLNGRLTLTANITSLTCTGMKASQSGVISLVQDGTGSRTMVAAWCTAFRWASGTRGVLSTAINAIDALFYQCVSTTICYVSLSKAEAN